MKWDVFPKREDPTAVKLVDKRSVNKKQYLLNLLAREESCIIYVQGRGDVGSAAHETVT